MAPEVIHSAGMLKVLAWFETNKKQVIFGAGAAIVIGIVVYFILWQQNQKRVAAGEAFSKVFAAQLAGGRTGQSSEPFLKMAASYPASQAADRAVLMAAAASFTDGKYAEAQAQFEKFLREHRGSPLSSEASLGVAACLEAQGKTDDAVKAYTELVDRRPAGMALLQAKFALARIYDARKDTKKAFDLYKDIASADSFGSIGNEAGLRMEELKAKDPSLAPAPAATPTVTLPEVMATNAPAAAKK